MAADLINHPDFACTATSSLRPSAAAGPLMAPELVRRIDDNFDGGAHAPQLGYGLTETNGYGPGNLGDDYVRKPSSTGRVLPIMQVGIVGPDGEELPTGKVGEVLLSGPMLIRGYWNRPEATEEALADGALRTGDLGYLDDEGFLYIVDRAKDMVLRGGEDVYCAEVEARSPSTPGCTRPPSSACPRAPRRGGRGRRAAPGPAPPSTSTRCGPSWRSASPGSWCPPSGSCATSRSPGGDRQDPEARDPRPGARRPGLSPPTTLRTTEGPS